MKNPHIEQMYAFSFSRKSKHQINTDIKIIMFKPYTKPISHQGYGCFIQTSPTPYLPTLN